MPVRRPTPKSINRVASPPTLCRPYSSRPVSTPKMAATPASFSLVLFGPLPPPKKKEEGKAKRPRRGLNNFAALQETRRALEGKRLQKQQVKAPNNSFALIPSLCAAEEDDGAGGRHGRQHDEPAGVVADEQATLGGVLPFFGLLLEEEGLRGRKTMFLKMGGCFCFLFFSFLGNPFVGCF